MQYSPGNAIPYISRVDAGTIELIRQLGVEVNVYVTEREAIVTGTPVQTEIIPILP